MLPKKALEFLFCFALHDFVFSGTLSFAFIISGEIQLRIKQTTSVKQTADDLLFKVNFEFVSLIISFIWLIKLTKLLKLIFGLFQTS